MPGQTYSLSRPAALIRSAHGTCAIAPAVVSEVARETASPCRRCGTPPVKVAAYCRQCGAPRGWRRPGAWVGVRNAAAGACRRLAAVDGRLWFPSVLWVPLAVGAYMADAAIPESHVHGGMPGDGAAFLCVLLGILTGVDAITAVLLWLRVLKLP